MFIIRVLTVAIFCIAFLPQNLNAQNSDKKTIEQYWEAARSGDTAKVKKLLDAGVDVDAVTEFNCGAVYFAANRNQTDVLRALIKAGADVNLRDTDYGFTPIQMAAWLGHAEATEILIDARASKNDTERDNRIARCGRWQNLLRW